MKRLFRKVNDKSADYDPTHNGKVRRDGSYIYEVFLATGGTDVKVGTSQSCGIESGLDYTLDGHAPAGHWALPQR